MVDLTVVLALSLAVIASFFSCCHKIHEGHIGVYWRNGALLEKTTDPGVHLKLPLLTTVDSLQIIMQTDKVTNIPCGTRGGEPAQARVCVRHSQKLHSQLRLVVDIRQSAS